MHFGRLRGDTARRVRHRSVSAPLGLSGASAANLDEACGGPNKITCNSALYCRVPAGNAAPPTSPGPAKRRPTSACGFPGRSAAATARPTSTSATPGTPRSRSIRGRCKKPPATGGPRRPQARDKEKEEGREAANRPASLRKRRCAPLTTSSAATCLTGTFPKRCCFQVIYFVRNISLLPRQTGRSPAWKPLG